MGYRKIQNLYKDIRILDFEECFALEKIHGTSAHILYRKGEPLKFFSGGAKHESFVNLFEQLDLLSAFRALPGEPEEVIVYGEAYGGKMQGMSATYGKELRFVAFEAKVDGEWLAVPYAERVTSLLGLEFVDYNRGPATVDWLNEQRDLPSRIAKRRGIAEDKVSEGVVVRPINEGYDRRGHRIITKHKGDSFRETKTKREIDPEKLLVLARAKEVAEEWVTPMRMEHVLDKLRASGSITDELRDIPTVIKAMQGDVKAESEGEVVWSKSVEKAIGAAAVHLYKKSVSKI
jgi:hypothetical protein